MKIIILTPYSPWPANTGTKIEIMKHLDLLKEIGECTIVSAKGKPVGFGWTDESQTALKAKGFALQFREDKCKGLLGKQIYGICYAALCKGMGLDKAFGHSNPYHRYAFEEKWWQEISSGYDLAVMFYGYWSRFATSCPKVIAVHELLSNYHWEGAELETKEMATAQGLIVVGKDEEESLRARGVQNILWSPPTMQSIDLPLTEKVALVGTIAPQNLEGLKWLESTKITLGILIEVYGNIASRTKAPFLVPIGAYKDRTEPYNNCGIHLMTRADRPGLQIKVVEALACGRVIIARKGSMRGLPANENAWIEVNSPEEMMEKAALMAKNKIERQEIAANAQRFYRKHLDCDRVVADLRKFYLNAAGKK